MALTSWGDILNKPNGVDEVPEIALTVEQLSASVLSISEDVGEIALDVSQLSASVLSIGEDVTEISNQLGKPVIKKTNSNVSVTHGSITKIVETDDYLAIGKYIAMYEIRIGDSGATVRDIACQIRVNGIIADESVLKQNSYSSLKTTGCILINVETENSVKGYIELYLNSLDLTISDAIITIIQIP